jgi:hypothetical protein
LAALAQQKKNPNQVAKGNGSSVSPCGARPQGKLQEPENLALFNHSTNVNRRTLLTSPDYFPVRAPDHKHNGNVSQVELERYQNMTAGHSE